MYFFELTTSPNVLWFEMDRLTLDEGSPTLVVDRCADTLVGDVTDRFTPGEMPFWASPTVSDGRHRLRSCSDRAR